LERARLPDRRELLQLALADRRASQAGRRDHLLHFETHLAFERLGIEPTVGRQLLLHRLAHQPAEIGAARDQSVEQHVPRNSRIAAGHRTIV
jgi:hypothetical protein